ncbi:malto-oligosyltrehalose synthase [Kineobactrum salinum]|uniref:Malto-oligosyltrehalose synthase n=1 Tax=Kineobactrum salinum TaxID=2708301 RepID=A0A6C0UB49_9GAMM|nr:malto-oligosyltrehalose synthase [Kineobactrum salinum]QIB67204.1 malto-oligosyltrehalose synthase [Kineobactrum salinum]
MATAPMNEAMLQNPRLRATYRVQLNSSFTFDDASAQLSYFDALGVSHLYSSPFLKARAGSTHGYDITDHNSFNPEVGDEHSFAALTDALAGHGMGLIPDFVPNHMGIGKADNNWWLDVLEWGQASPYAPYFDIDWQQATAPVRGKLLLPFLGDIYGTVLEAGELQLRCDPSQGSFAVHYHEHLYPIGPRHYAGILATVIAVSPALAPREELQALAQQFRTLGISGASAARQQQLRRQATQLKARLAALLEQHPQLLQAIEHGLQQYNGVPGRGASFIHLHRLLQRQTYRLAYWRVAADEINYRRFFDINDLAGICVEREAVFEDVHRLMLKLLAAGRIDGLRIDHVDGLYDPAGYCRKLQRAAMAVSANSAQPLYLLMEKILADHERPRPDWPVAGTTGYEALNHINRLFLPPATLAALERFYLRFSSQESFDEVLTRAKRQVIEHVLASEIQVLANRFSRLAETSWHTRDFTLAAIHSALTEIVVYFPVYRTYTTAAGPDPADRRDIDWAVGLARRNNSLINPALFEFLRGILSTDLARPRSGFNRNEVLRIAMKFQQYTGPVMAKSLEDTAFYRYFPLLSLNEVGGDPRRVDSSMAGFHHFIADRAEHWPHAMVTTGTHDSKRGEDVRARLNALARVPREWELAVRRWTRLNRSKLRVLDEQQVPSRNEQYFLYQTLVGSWPAAWSDGGKPDDDGLAHYRERISSYMLKSLREAKLNSSWLHPDEAYESAVTGFVDQLLHTPDTPFALELGEFAQGLAPLGVVNSLGQTTLKFTLPGVPDIYQGTELWDLHLVDPDNRGQVDYQLRTRLLREISAQATHDPAGLVSELSATWSDARIKLYIIWRLLDLRRRRAELFKSASYHPLEVTGADGNTVCAFARSQGGSQIVTVVACAATVTAGGRYPFGQDYAGAVLLGEYGSGGLRDVLTGIRFRPEGAAGSLPLAALLARLPVAVLETD